MLLDDDLWRKTELLMPSLFPSVVVLLVCGDSSLTLIKFLWLIPSCIMDERCRIGLRVELDATEKIR